MLTRTNVQAHAVTRPHPVETTTRRVARGHQRVEEKNQCRG
jgi:hypothetical protein